MKSAKFRKKLAKLFVRAEEALDRSAAQKLILKAERLFTKTITKDG